MSRWLLWGAALVAIAATPSCKTEGFCFENCDDNAVGGQGGAGASAAAGGVGGGLGAQGGLFGEGGGGTGGSECTPSIDGIEICNGQDDDCDGRIDEPETPEDAEAIDFSNIRQCGTCDNDCTELIVRGVATCTPSAAPGVEPGTCDYSTCSDDWYDVDGDRSNGCEYYCQWNRDGSNTTDPGAPGQCGADDDCDGVIDDEMDTCVDYDNCGGCGLDCDRPHATTACVSTVASGCDESNAGCEVTACDTDWHDIDSVADNGCEYPCTVTNGGAEICDGLDNNCDGQVDNADPDLETDDAAVGQDCFGSPIGLCGTDPHKGVSKCIAGAIQCCDVDSNNAAPADPSMTGVRNGVCEGAVAPFVLFPDEAPDTCDGVDNNCDDVIDGVGAKTNPIACTTDANCVGQSPYTRCLEDLGNPGNRFCAVQPTDVGAVCGTAEGSCEIGTILCENGVQTCIGAVGAAPEVCDGEDNDCDGVIDGTRPAAVVSCTSDAQCSAPNVSCLPLGNDVTVRGCVQPPTDVANTSGFLACDDPIPPPQGAGSPCEPGVAACRGGIPVCEGSTTAAAGATDECGEDTNCNGILENQTGLSNSDPDDCGTCGFACSSLGANADWTCVNGACNRVGCQPGFIECGGSNADDCETACTFQSSNEACDGQDDDCDCQVDESPTPLPTPAQVCGVSPSATDAGCTSGVTLTCTSGGWQCTFPNGYCTGGNCATAADTCDGLDNDCDGVADESFVAPNRTQGFLGQACNSDDGQTLGHGPCQATGVFVCNAGGTDTVCSAAKNDAAATNELCDGVDNDCDGVVDDDADVVANDSRVAQACFGGPDGVCGDPSNAGATACVSGAVACAGANLVFPGDLDETCNGDDDDCDGTADNNLIDDGNPCGNGLGQCSPGTFSCVGGILLCQGGQAPVPEVCDGLDNDCNGLIDNASTDVGGPCDVPQPVPAGATQPCQAGTSVCIGGTVFCQGSIVPEPGAVDECGDDTDCDGVLENQAGLSNSDPANCGSCGNDCSALGANGVWQCNAGVCTRTGCQNGFIECDPTNPNDCETTCAFAQAGELCNGADDNCNCQTDEPPFANMPTPAQVCGVSPSATDAGCTSGVTLTCTSGGWQCAFPNGYCTGGSCATTTDICDGLDNDCDGVADESFVAPNRTQGFLGQACNSDDGQALGHGPCQAIGVFVCNAGGTDTVCSAAKNDAAATNELCDGVDNDCDGVVDDDADVVANDSRVAQACFGGPDGVCGDPSNAGATACVSGAVACAGANLVFPGDLDETCNGDDDDCDGTADNNLIDDGNPCGNGLGQCSPGTFSCVGGILLCQGGQAPVPEVCDGLDNDCNGLIDNASTDVGGPCDVPPPEPPGATQPCQAGTSVCIGGTVLCQGSIVAELGAVDECGEDTDCDGVLENQTGLSNSDPANCGSCGNDCSALGANGVWQCNSGVCTRTGCQNGFIECDSANPNDCETTCAFAQAGELCNGADDNCNCQTDETPFANMPTPVQVCGVSPSATDAGCTTGVALACGSSGTWQCTFPAGYCTGPDCASTPDICDGLDNDCDGIADESFVAPARTQGFVGQACNSDDGLPLTHGPCQTTGVFVCNAGGTDTACSAVKNDLAAADETCDGVDNDCDGAIDDTADVVANDPAVAQTCFGGPQGVCSDPANAGTTACINGAVECSGTGLVFPGDRDETCNGDDDDCDGTADNNLIDDGNPCGNGLGECSPGTYNCVGGTLVCQGGLAPVPELCDGLDNDCDGLIDDTPTDVGGACDIPPPAPAGASQPCQPGTLVCIGGGILCQGSILPEAGALDECGDDTDCDGILENQTGLANNDVQNCGSCGNDCNALDANANWSCQSGTCVVTSCKAGSIDCDANPSTCETACTFASSSELCNGIDDDCDCQTDEVADLATPTPVQACGVGPSAAEAGCTTGVTIACVSAAWECTFPASYCTGATCAATTDTCDGLDNDCDGQIDEPFKYPQLTSAFLGQACASDDGLASSHGPCRTAGVFVCAPGGAGTECNADIDLGQSSGETCNGIDDDCDGTPDDGTLGGQCFAGTTGLCAAPGSAGVAVCVSGAPQCQGAGLVAPGDVADTCNGLDDDCDGFIDAIAPPSNPVSCEGNPALCASQGIYSLCRVDQTASSAANDEFCVAPSTDEGAPCASGVGSCQTGIGSCVSGSIQCTGFTGPTPELCNGLDDDCDGVIDGTVDPGGAIACATDVQCAAGAPYLRCLPNSTNGNATECVRGPTDVADGATGAALACDAPPGSPIVGPVGACTTVAFPCQPGTLACQSGVPICQNSVTADATTPDGCCEDSNCDGTLDLGTQPDTDTDEVNCGSCGNDCSDDNPTAQALYICVGGTCQFDQCEPGFIDCDGDDVCETACVSTGAEVCNGADDDCNCVDDDVDPGSIPTGVQVCGVRGITDPFCADGDGLTGVLVQCVGGAWDCTFPPEYCATGTCATSPDVCDTKDNDCDGNIDENFKPPILVNAALGDVCYSDDGLPAPGDGACQGEGIFVCDGPTATICNAVRQDGDASQERCNGIDDDCDGSVDETYLDPGSNPTHVRPGVVGVDTDASGSDDLWVFQFEASRTNATLSSPGSGNGYHCGPGGCTGVPDGPAGVTLDGSIACSVEDRIPWFNVTPVEVEQTCQAIGGFVCDDADWTQACEGETSGCTWGYATSCTTSASDTCNLHDFDVNADALLPTQSISDCYANVAGERLYDVTGNLREITKRIADDYRVLGGAFNTHAESGATCQFDFISVPKTFQFYDTGFRCCFGVDPSPGQVCGDGVCETGETNANCATDCP